jgi:chromosome segregation ATPase
MSGIGALSPADVKLPNRRTARDTTPRFESELSAIRRELNQIQSEIVNDVQQGGGAQSDLESEVNGLYHELQRAAANLEQEKSLRKRVEAELESLRSGRLRDTADVVQELERKRTELQTLREERAMMKEWLDRGVAECKRVADEVTRLKAELDISEKSCANLSKDKQRLAVTVQELNEELSSVQTALEKVHHEKTVLELKAEDAVSSLARAEEQRRAAVSEADRLSAEVVRLSQRVRGLEDGEISLQSMCSCIDALCREINVLERAVTNGNLDEANTARPPLSDAANDIGQPKALPVMIVDAKRLLQHLQDSVSRLRGTVKRYIGETQRQVNEQYRAQNVELENIRRERDVLVQAHQQEAAQLRRRVMDLEAEIVHVAQGVQRDISMEASERLTQLDRLSSSNRQAQKENEELKAENERLKAKCKKMKIDWTKVDESRRRYQQLQVEVQLMKDYSDKLAQENRNLKLLLEAKQQHTKSRSADGSLPHYLEMDSAAQVHRAAFEDWKNEVSRNSLPPSSPVPASSPGHLNSASPYRY